MKKTLSVIVLQAISLSILGQDITVRKLREESDKKIEKEDTLKEGWAKRGVLSLNLAQGSSSNWASGAEKFSFSTNILVNPLLLYKKGRNSWDNSLTLQYGVVNTTSLGSRKTDDRIDLISKYGYQLRNGKWYLSILANFRTQFTDGYNYTDTAKIRNSAFMAPAYLLLSPGLDYRPTVWLSVFLSPVTSRWVMVTNHAQELATLFGIEAGKKSKYEIGAFLTANLKKDIFKNVNYTSRLDLFSNYRDNPQNIDVYWTNIIAMKINKFLQATYNFDLIYDDNAINSETGKKWGTEVKSLLGVGLSVRF